MVIAAADRKTLSIAKACELVGVTRRTIYNWIAGGKVEYVRTAGGSVRIFVDTLWRDPASGPSRHNLWMGGPARASMSSEPASVPAPPTPEEPLALRQARSGQLDEDRLLPGQDKRERRPDEEAGQARRPIRVVHVRVGSGTSDSHGQGACTAERGDHGGAGGHALAAGGRTLRGREAGGVRGWHSGTRWNIPRPCSSARRAGSPWRPEAVRRTNVVNRRPPYWTRSRPPLPRKAPPFRPTGLSRPAAVGRGGPAAHRAGRGRPAAARARAPRRSCWSRFR